MAVSKGWSVRDLLCSATHMVAEAVAGALRRRIPPEPPIAELIVTGGGQQNGFLLREIGQCIGLPLVRLDELGEDLPQSFLRHASHRAPTGTESLAADAFGAAAIAVLAMLYLDQVPANSPAITGAETPRLLGRLTPGSPQNWQRLLHAATGNWPAIRPLRSAI